MQDKRSEPRQRIVLQGEIISGNGLRMSCAIRDISDRGARVSVVTPFHVTDLLTLLIPARHKLRNGARSMAKRNASRSGFY